VTKPKKLTAEQRFPNRLRKVLNVAIEAARGGSFAFNRVVWATVGRFAISYRTPFNWPQFRPGKLYRLCISDAYGICLDVLWTDREFIVQSFRDPSGNKWDQRLRKLAAK